MSYLPFPSRVFVAREAGYSDRPRPRLLDRVREAIRARHYSRRTEEAYVAWIRRYILFHGKRHPAELGAAEITQFLTSLDRLTGQRRRHHLHESVTMIYMHVLNRGPAAARSPAARMFGP